MKSLVAKAELFLYNSSIRKDDENAIRVRNNFNHFGSWFSWVYYLSK